MSAERMNPPQLDALKMCAAAWADGEEVEIVAGPLRIGARWGDQFHAAIFTEDRESVLSWCPIHREWEIDDELDATSVAGRIAWREIRETRDSDGPPA